MNLTALHHYLTTLSDSELRYQAGQPFGGWDRLGKTVMHGREVYILSPFEAPGLPPKSERLSGGPEIWRGAHGPNLMIKRNSRFNPVPEHIHSHIEINYVYSGSCPQIIDGTPVVLEENQVLLIDTACPHSISTLGKNDIMLSMLVAKNYLRGHIFSQFSQDSVLSHFFINTINEKTSHDHFLLFHSEHDRRIPLFFRELFSECFDPSINSADIILHLFYTIMAELINVYENDMAKEQNFSSGIPIVPMIRYIENNFRTCTQTSVARFFHISPNYVSILLKKHTGLSYIQLIQEQKLKYAARLLSGTDYSVTEISHDAGYENVSFFYKKFQEKYGCLPGEYRESFLPSEQKNSAGPRTPAG